MNHGASSHENWFYDSPVHSDVEAKLRNFLVDLRNDDRILGIQVCAYKDGEVIIDTAAGVLGKDDPRPVQPDSLFPLFSVTKGVAAGMVHWLADKGKLKLDEYVANFWPEFGTNGKEQIKHASGKKFQDVLEEAFVRPLQIEGELYIGIPPGVESRLATITVDKNEFTKLSQNTDPNKVRGTATTKQPSSLTLSLLDILIPMINILDVRRAIIPALNLHASARALTRYYAALVDVDTKIFTNTKDKVHDAFVGSGDCKDLILQNGKIGLGFVRLEAAEGGVLGFGHAGFGGSTGYADINNRFAISVTLNLASSGALTGEIIRFICSELNLPVPEDYAESRDFTENPKIN